MRIHRRPKMLTISGEVTLVAKFVLVVRAGKVT
jgi:hypothetical protein